MHKACNSLSIMYRCCMWLTVDCDSIWLKLQRQFYAKIAQMRNAIGFERCRTETHANKIMMIRTWWSTLANNLLLGSGCAITISCMLAFTVFHQNSGPDQAVRHQVSFSGKSIYVTACTMYGQIIPNRMQPIYFCSFLVVLSK